jgi:hypothetical protein
MATPREWLSRLWGSVRGRRQDRDLEEELRLHVELAEEEARRRGDSADAARRVRLQVGGVSQAMDALRDQRGLPWLEELRQDIRHALRVLRRSPVFTTIALITIALGIGANSAIFSVLRATSLRTAGLPDPDRLAIIWTQPRGQVGTLEGARIVEYFAWRERAASFANVGAMLPWSSTLGSIRPGEPAERLAGWRFTASAFRALGVAPQLGRVLTDADMPVDGPDDKVVISDRLWRSQLDADPGVLGRTILLDGKTTTIVGVMPPRVLGVHQPAGLLDWHGVYTLPASGSEPQSSADHH